MCVSVSSVSDSTTAAVYRPTIRLAIQGLSSFASIKSISASCALVCLTVSLERGGLKGRRKDIVRSNQEK